MYGPSGIVAAAITHLEVWTCDSGPELSPTVMIATNPKAWSCEVNVLYCSTCLPHQSCQIQFIIKAVLSCMYLAHHELGSVMIFDINIKLFSVPMQPSRHLCVVSLHV